MLPTTRIMTATLQHRFAELSGDFNPQHVDTLAARRMFFGFPVVHGIHSALWALDHLCGADSGRRSLRTLDIIFRAPVAVGDTLILGEVETRDNLVKAKLFCRDSNVLRATFTFQPQERPAAWAMPPRDEEPVCRWMSEADLADHQGSVPLGFDPALLTALFPHLAQGFHPGQLAVILASTRLVGMECPGRHSVYSRLKLEFGTGAIGPDLTYRVQQWEARFRHIAMTIAGSGATGRIECFMPPAPVEQPGLAEARAQVGADEFKTHRALIIGGSRGLGETIAKVVAAGGGGVCVTYQSGKADAERLVAELRAEGAEAYSLPLDVLSPAIGRDSLPWPVTHLYYCASPRITPGADWGLDSRLLARYLDYYCTGLAAVIGALKGAFAERFTVIYPSTIFLDQPEAEFGEYMAAKAAGEEVARILAANLPGCAVLTPRLPRLPTDQTQSLSELDLAEPLPVVVELVRSSL